MISQLIQHTLQGRQKLPKTWGEGQLPRTYALGFKKSLKGQLISKCLFEDGGNSFIFILFLFENSFILLGNSFILEY